jgi:MoaA/NifB/PqqE/SkfB family radical SAM enzyme
VSPARRSFGGRDHRIITGPATVVLRSLIVLDMLRVALGHHSSLGASRRAVWELRQRRQTYFGGTPVKKLVGFHHRLYMGLNTPGWPSHSFTVLVRKELNRTIASAPNAPYLRTLIFGITTKCSLNCRHCYAGAVLNQPEVLRLEDLKTILAKFQHLGLAQLQWSGGEPLCRFEEMMALTREAEPGTDFWVLSSGMGLTPERARDMKEAGITGVNISLDHWLPEQHNAFRGSESSYTWVQEAIHNARAQRLLVAVTLCATPQFVSKKNLWSYAALAERMGVAFIQILEARAIGHLAGVDVELDSEKLAILDDFFRTANGARTRRRLPIVIYHGYRQRRFGCSGAGDDFLYVDPLGMIHPCPFSETLLGNALTDDLEQVLCCQSCNCDRYVLARRPSAAKPPGEGARRG